MKRLTPRWGPLVAGGALALAPSGASAYRTASDLSEFADTPAVRWVDPTFAVELQSALAPGLDLDRALADIDAAGSSWTAIGCGEFQPGPARAVRVSPAPGDGRVSMQFVMRLWRERGFDVNAAGVTDVTYEQDADDEWRIVDGDVYFNAESFTWTHDGVDGEAPRDLRAVVTHEFGHVYGMLHPCEEASDVAPACTEEQRTAAMFPEYLGLSQRALGDDDELGICSLYPDRPCDALGCSGDLVCADAGCAAPCGAEVCALGERCDPSTGCTSCPFGRCGLGCTTFCGAPPGDPCATHAQCSSGYCDAPSQSCLTRCNEDVCNGEATCDRSGEIPVCRNTRAAFAARCTASNDCISELCIEEEPDAEAYCTRACGESFSPCPAGFACLAVDGADVCRRPPPAPAEGCTVGSSRAVTAPLGLVTLLLLLARMRRARSK